MPITSTSGFVPPGNSLSTQTTLSSAITSQVEASGTLDNSNHVMRSAASVRHAPVAPEAGADTYHRPRMVTEKFAQMLSPVEGESVTAMAKHMSSAVDRFGHGQVLETSGFMSQLQGLSAETSSFEGQQRIAEMSEEAFLKGVEPDFSNRLRDVEEGMVVQLKTAEGDLVEIKLEAANGDGGEKGVAFSFSVDGDLSEAERAAIGEMAEGLGKLADRFFADGEAALDELGSLKSDQLQGFSLELESKEFGDLTLEHSVSMTEGTQRFEGEFKGYTFDVTQSLSQDYVDAELINNPQYQQYLSLIEQAGRDYSTEAETIDFLKDGLNALFGVSAQEADAEQVEPIGGGSSLRQGFFSNMPDFSASFDSPVFVNEYNRTDTAYMSLTMSQETSQTFAGGVEEAAQRFSYSETVETFEPLPGSDEANLKAGYYVHQTLQRSEETLRLLSMSGDQPESAVESRKGEESLVREHKVRFQVEKVDKEEEQHSTIRNLMEEAQSMEGNFRQNMDMLLDSDNLKLFEYMPKPVAVDQQQK